MTTLKPGNLYKKYMKLMERQTASLTEANAEQPKMSSGFMSRQGQQEMPDNSSQPEVDPRIAAFNYINGYRKQILNNRLQAKKIDGSEGNI